MGRKFELGTKIDDLEYGRLYVLIKELSTQFYSSPEGFSYHFQYDMTIDPKNDLLLIGTPIDHSFSFPTPIRFNGELTFEFYTYKPYLLQTDIYQCYIDYTQPFLTMYKVDGSDHNLTNLDIVSINNFECRDLISAENSNADTFKQN